MNHNLYLKTLDKDEHSIYLLVIYFIIFLDGSERTSTAVNIGGIISVSPEYMCILRVSKDVPDIAMNGPVT